MHTFSSPILSQLTCFLYKNSPLVTSQREHTLNHLFLENVMGNPQPIKITSITLIMYLVYLIFDVISIKGVIFDCFKNALVERKLLLGLTDTLVTY